MFLYIDAFTMCNLRCPSCVVGDVNRPEGRRTPVRKMMDVAMLAAVLDKALKELPAIDGVGFFNWTEPLLHPQISELIAEVSRRKIPCWVSTNLNVLRNVDALLAARPHEIVVSVSGFHQEIYARGHKGGNIETVKRNMVLLSEAAHRNATAGSRTWLRLVYHRYADNEEDELLMAKYAERFGFSFSPCWAYVTSVERVLDLYRGETEFEEDRNLLQRLAVAFPAAMNNVSRQAANHCNHIDGRLVLDANADVYLCCASSNASSNIVGNFLAEPLADLQRAKSTHTLCRPCMKSSVMDYFDRSNIDDEEFNRLGNARRRENKALAGYDG